MSILNFTVKYALFASLDDSVDEGIDADVAPLTGTARFTPITRDDIAPIMAPSYDPPAGFRLLPITGYIDANGVLRASRGGPEGVRLWANDPVLGLSALGYRVDFSVTTLIGEEVPTRGGYFAAPNDDRVIELADVLQTGSSIGGPRLVGGEFTGGDVVFENEDGTFLEAIEIPAGTLVFVDNGDSTWSVG